MKEVLLPAKTESIVLSIMKKNTPVIVTPEVIRRDQKRAEDNFTLELWNELKLKYTEKELITHFFFGNNTGYMIYKNDADNRERMEQHIKNNVDPNHLSIEELDEFYADESQAKKLSATDHHIVLENNKCKLGDKKLQLQLETLVFNTIGNYQFSAEAIKGMAEKYNLPLSLQDCKEKAEEINQVLKKMALISARKSGVIDMEDEYLKFLNMYSKKNNYSPELTNAMAIKGKKLIRQMQTNLARNLATAMTSKDKTGVLRGMVRSFKSQLHSMGYGVNDAMSLMISETG